MLAGRPKALLALLLVAALAAGSALRVVWLDQQILMGDEWHGLLMLQDHSWGYLASHFGRSDHCIPLTLLHKLLDSWIGIDEVIARLVPLAFGIATIVVLPVLTLRAVGSTCAGRFALLLAISPFLTYMSRLSRPYAPALMLTWVAVLALLADARRARRASAFGFVVCAALAVWMLPLVAPFLLAAWLATGLSRRNLLLGLGAGIAGGTLLAPALLADLATLLDKGARTSVTRTSVDGAISLLVGVGPRTLAGALAILALAGLCSLWRQDRALVRVLAAGSLAQALVIACSRPDGVNVQLILARYCMAALPLLLLGLARVPTLVASGLTAGLGPTRARLVELGATGALLAALLVGGPWRAAYWFPNQWTGHDIYQGDYEDLLDPVETALRPAQVSKVYDVLAALPPASTTIVETPFFQAPSGNPYGVMQHHHRQRVIGGLATGLVPGTLPALPHRPGHRAPVWTTPVTDLEALRLRKARYILVHKDLRAEFPHIQFLEPTDAAPIERFLRERLGAPCFADAVIVAFELR